MNNKAQYFLPGGEIGTQVAPMLKEFYKNKSVDLSLLHYMKDDELVRFASAC